MKILDRKKRLAIEVYLLFSVLLLGIFISFAFFTRVNNNDKHKTSFETGNMRLRFADNDNGINQSIAIQETVIKKFLVENTGDFPASISLNWDELVNTYLNGSLTYNLSYSESLDGEYEVLVPESNVPVTNIELEQNILGELSVPSETTYYFNLSITFNNLKDVDQTNDMSATFRTKFSLEDPRQYIYYNLAVDPNGGTWKEFISTQNYKLRFRETMSIDNPTRVGHTIDGWEVRGVASSIENETFQMGMYDTKLIAKWNINKYKSYD